MTQKQPSFMHTIAAACTLTCTLAGASLSGIHYASAAGSVDDVVAGAPMRGIGPAFMGGRISHVEVDPKDDTRWFVAVASGGVWKTINAGVTFTPVFDNQISYSIGTIAIDPNNSNVVWVGTGENVSGRHVGWGDGLYKSLDGGQTWAQMGLEKSEHISRILVDPRDSNTVFVAAEGPLWSAGGERGVYKTTDGGASWQAVLTVDEDTGVTDIEFQPDNPDVIYAATYQRRRHVWGLMAGGPGTGIYKSSDNGDNWREVTLGLPTGDMGKIGMAVTPADPSRVFVTIEASDDEKGFYRSDDFGESWSKLNSITAGGTGPHYYQELEASPTDPNTIYQMDVFLRVTRDGGETFSILESGWDKHSDNHAFWIDPDNGNHLLAGSDAGLYESFDDGASWRHFPNLPISQFYKVAADNAVPFYNILGGAQDLGTIGGPSRTMNTDGVRNRDWYVPLGADGYGVAFDPADENIQYMEFQQGTMFRLDATTKELVGIQPQPAPGEDPERWNWDTPIVTSEHVEGRIYTGSQRVWRSDDRGDNWTAISGDLSQGINRYTLEYNGRVWSVDDLHDNGAMSKYSTLTSISESPVNGDILYTGSDDGYVHLSSNGGGDWRRLSDLPGVPDYSFINDVEASQHDENTVFVVADAHKIGDYRPYLFRSTNQGRKWQSIAGDLPDGVLVWAIQQDHVNENLLFIGAENGVYVSVNGGKNWDKLAGSPTVPMRDVKLQRRDNDVVAASFGRGFYILDDYTPFRELASRELNAGVLPVRDAWWYIPNEPMQAPGQPTLGTDSWRAENPEVGAMITFYMENTPKTMTEARHETEKELREEGDDAAFPGYDALQAEADEAAPRLMVRIADGDGNAVRLLKVAAKDGVQRVTWDMRLPAPDAIDLAPPGFRPPWAGTPQGPLAAPGSYNAQLVLVSGGEVANIGAAQSFDLNPVPNGPDGTDYAANAAFQQHVSELVRRISVMGEKISRSQDLLRHMKVAVVSAPRADADMISRLDDFGVAMGTLQRDLYGDRIRDRLNESSSPSIAGRIYYAAFGASGTREAATGTHRANVALGEQGLAEAGTRLDDLLMRLATLEAELDAAGAPSWR